MRVSARPLTAAIGARWPALLTTAALLLSPAVTPSATPDSQVACKWRRTAVLLYQELAGETSARARLIHTILDAFGVGNPEFLPQKCRTWPTPPPNTNPPSGPSTGAGTSAAERFGWGQPNRVDEFDSGLGSGWNVYDGPGHAGNGRRTPDAVSVNDGILTITGDSNGATAGMAWNPGQKYGRWEGRVKAPASDESYNALLLLWPDAENFPVGGEIDFMEMMDHTRQTTSLFLHYGADNSQVDGEVNIDGTQWHNWAVEWTPDHVAAFVDGKEWFRTTDKSILPPGPMHLCIQLDWFPGDGNGSVQESQMQVDWVKQYPLTGTSSAPESGETDTGQDADTNPDSVDSSGSDE